MSIGFVNQVRKAVAQLNPSEIRESSARPVKILLVADSSASSAAMEDYLAPETLSRRKRTEALAALTRPGDPPSPGSIDLLLLEDGMAAPKGWKTGHDLFLFDHARPEAVVREIVERRDELALALARLFEPFRRAVVKKTIHTVSKENALFSLMTAIPNVLPNAFELPWAVGEFASDTAVLTANQIRMAFFLAGASDREVGFKEQRSQIGSIIAGAWGWRAIARELTGKIPFGGGLIPKAAIAYAGTYVVGLSLERVYRIGYGLSREEREGAYAAAFEKGKEVAGALLESLRKDTK
jgi:hypothetical protein